MSTNYATAISDKPARSFDPRDYVPTGVWFKIAAPIAAPLIIGSASAQTFTVLNTEVECSAVTFSLQRTLPECQDEARGDLSGMIDELAAATITRVRPGEPPMAGNGGDPGESAVGGRCG